MNEEHNNRGKMDWLDDGGGETVKARRRSPGRSKTFLRIAYHINMMPIIGYRFTYLCSTTIGDGLLQVEIHKQIMQLFDKPFKVNRNVQLRRLIWLLIELWKLLTCF